MVNLEIQLRRLTRGTSLSGMYCAVILLVVHIKHHA